MTAIATLRHLSETQDQTLARLTHERAVLVECMAAAIKAARFYEPELAVALRRRLKAAGVEVQT